MARILVVDDEQQVRLIFRRILERAGHEVEEASGGRQAVEACRARCPDLIVTDLFMPDMDGFEVLLEILRDCPGVRAICITGGSRVFDARIAAEFPRAALRFGALEVLAKPVRAADLVAAVTAVLAKPVVTPAPPEDPVA